LSFKLAASSGRLDTIEEVEEFVDVGFHSQLSAVPGGKRNPRSQVLDLEPVFDVDGEEERGQTMEVPKVR
jgi:hypothetical protein